MPSFSPQHYAKVGKLLKADLKVVTTAVGIASRITATHPERAVILTLRHLAALSGVEFRLLRDWVGRWGGEPYREFFLAKKPDRRKKALRAAPRARRRIAAPVPELMRQQRWLVERVLHHTPRHDASRAFHRKANIKETARLHCGCKWLIKMDIRNFFESIYEPKVYEVFLALGYPRLLAFELTRLCTRIVPRNWHESHDMRRPGRFHAKRGPCFYSRVRAAANADGAHILAQRDREENWISETRAIDDDNAIPLPLGSLPQGAPTSPLLANLAVRGLDDALLAMAGQHGLVYTRYADDIALSTKRKDFTREEAVEVIGKVLRAFEREGLRPHHAKTRIVPPGARKIVLGLMVDDSKPQLTREYRNKLRLHAHMLGTKGIAPSAHAAALKFRSVLAMRRHIEGKIAHARLINKDFADRIDAMIAGVDWTL